MSSEDSPDRASPKSLEVYAAFRDLVKHEDLLRNERLKTLFTIQSILFGALAFALKDSNSLLIFPIGVFAVFVANYYKKDLENGETAMNSIVKCWSTHEKFDLRLPTVIGTHNPDLRPVTTIVNALYWLWGMIIIYGVASAAAPHIRAATSNI